MVCRVVLRLDVLALDLRLEDEVGDLVPECCKCCMQLCCDEYENNSTLDGASIASTYTRWIEKS